MTDNHPNGYWDVTRACPACGRRGFTDVTYAKECPRCESKGFIITESGTFHWPDGFPSQNPTHSQ